MKTNDLAWAFTKIKDLKKHRNDLKEDRAQLQQACAQQDSRIRELTKQASNASKQHNSMFIAMLVLACLWAVKTQPQQQQGPSMPALAFHGLALSASRPQLWQQLSLDQQLDATSKATAEMWRQIAAAIVSTSGRTPADWLETNAIIEESVAALTARLTKAHAPKPTPLPAAAVPVNTTSTWDERPYVPAPPVVPGNTTCSWDERPHLPAPAPLPAAPACQAPSLPALLRCMPAPPTSRTAPPAAAPGSCGIKACADHVAAAPKATRVPPTAEKVTDKLSNWTVTQLVRALAYAVRWQDPAAKAAVLQRAAHATFIFGVI